MSDDISITEEGAWGVIRLTRPKTLNSLTRDMCAAFDEALIGWAANDDIRGVLVEGEGDRAFCAGGDIRWLYDIGRDDPETARHDLSKRISNECANRGVRKTLCRANGWHLHGRRGRDFDEC